MNYSKLPHDILTSVLICGLFVAFILGLNMMGGEINSSTSQINLDPKNLPFYCFKTAIRFICAMIFSVIFAILYATIAAKNKRMGKLLIPVLDLFQSVPVIGYISFSVTFFIGLFPNSMLGIEFASVFAILTAQIWNIILSIYQSLKTVPKELYEVARLYKLNNWKIFWIIELPFSLPGIIWNVILSMSASWFFVVTQEVILVGNHNYTLPGMGGYIALALKNYDLKAIAYATIALATLIILFNELLYKPLIVLSEKFRYEFDSSSDRHNISWFLHSIRQSNILNSVFAYLISFCKFCLNLTPPRIISRYSNYFFCILEMIFWCSTGLVLYKIIIFIFQISYGFISISDIKTILFYGALTAARILSLLFICSLFWVPIGIYIGLRPKTAAKIQPITQLLTAIPANLYYPLFVSMIISYKLNPNIWLSFMLLIGSQWYILYNVIAGAQNIPTELLEVANLFKIKFSDRIFKILLPSIAPYYISGLMTAAGASWNASIVAETMQWGEHSISAMGIGSFITHSTKEGSYPHIILGIVIMCFFVIMINRLLWRPLSNYISARFNLA